ncbi:MAG TPA: nodulation protein NfeD [Candidatus Angelobacter sp.]|nr:nodulation protein NfeD [Candidatus Angelobacter sp.]
MRPNFLAKTGLSRIAIVAALLFASRAASADVLKAAVDGTINPITAEYFDRVVQEAQRVHTDAILVELNTPGGYMGSMERIIQKILASPVPIIIYVSPAGSDAGSAGFFILEAADVAAMAPGTHAGAAHPVRGDGVTMDPVMKEKLENYASSLLRSYVGKRGRNIEVAESAMKESKAFTADEALEKNLINYIAKDESDLFAQLEGKTITRFDGSKTVLHLAGKPVRLYEMTTKLHILAFLMDPNVLYLLFTVGLLCIYFEFNHPGAIVPGAIGFIVLLLFFYALNLLPFRSIALVLILSAFAFFVLEAKFQTHGVLGVGGIVLMVLGALLLIDGPIPELRVNIWTALAVSLPMGAITVFLMTIALKARRNKVVTGAQGMIGEIAIVCVPLTPSGKVFVQGELWDAVAPVNADAGSKVVVRQVENLVLHVEPVHEAVPQALVAG